MPVINVKVRDGEGSWRMICELPSANVLVVGFREHWVPRRELQRTSCSVIPAWNAGSSSFRPRLQTTWSSAAIPPRNSSVLRRPLPRTRKSHKAHPPCCASACAIAAPLTRSPVSSKTSRRRVSSSASFTRFSLTRPDVIFARHCRRAVTTASTALGAEICPPVYITPPVAGLNT